MANNSTEYETNDAKANSTTNNAQPNDTIPDLDTYHYKDYTITKYIKCVE